MAGALAKHFSKLPKQFREVLERAHVERAKGWPGLTLEGYLDDIEEQGHFAVVLAIFVRCVKSVPEIWSHVGTIRGIWTYEAGKMVSQGIQFTCPTADKLLELMKSEKAEDFFCKDIVNAHGPRETFRELITTGPGLHVCVTEPAARADKLHDIHIDRYQMVCKRMIGGYCDYVLDNLSAAENAYRHNKDAIPWWLEDLKKRL